MGGVLTTNRNLALLRAAFNWAIRLGHLEATPFKRHTETVVKLSKETRGAGASRGMKGSACSRPVIRCCATRGRRSRGPIQPRARLRPIVEAAIESGCRRGELLSLQWWQVKGLAGVKPCLDLPAAKTKTETGPRRADLDAAEGDPRDAAEGPAGEGSAGGRLRLRE